MHNNKANSKIPGTCAECSVSSDKKKGKRKAIPAPSLWTMFNSAVLLRQRKFREKQKWFSGKTFDWWQRPLQTAASVEEPAERLFSVCVCERERDGETEREEKSAFVCVLVCRRRKRGSWLWMDALIACIQLLQCLWETEGLSMHATHSAYSQPPSLSTSLSCFLSLSVMHFMARKSTKERREKKKIMTWAFTQIHDAQAPRFTSSWWFLHQGTGKKLNVIGHHRIAPTDVWWCAQTHSSLPLFTDLS